MYDIIKETLTMLTDNDTQVKVGVYFFVKIHDYIKCILIMHMGYYWLSIFTLVPRNLYGKCIQASSNDGVLYIHYAYSADPPTPWPSV